MKRPASIWLVALVLTAYGLSGAWVAVGARYWAPGVMALLSLAGAVGLVLGRRWARFFVYVVALLVVLSWAYAIWIMTRAGWPYRDAWSTAMALLPGALLVVLCGGSSVLVWRHFRRPSG